jgi:hypothetical protein
MLFLLEMCVEYGLKRLPKKPPGLESPGGTSGNRLSEV